MSDELNNDLETELQPGESIEEIAPEMMSADEQLVQMGEVFEMAEPMLEELGQLYQHSEQLTTEQLGEMQHLQQGILELGQQIKAFEKITSNDVFKDELEYQQKIMQEQDAKTGLKDLDDSLALIMATYHVHARPIVTNDLEKHFRNDSASLVGEKRLVDEAMGRTLDAGKTELGPLADDGLRIDFEGPDGSFVGEIAPDFFTRFNEAEPRVIESPTADNLEYADFVKGFTIDSEGVNGTIRATISPDLQAVIKEMKKSH